MSSPNPSGDQARWAIGLTIRSSSDGRAWQPDVAAKYLLAKGDVVSADGQLQLVTAAYARSPKCFLGDVHSEGFPLSTPSDLDGLHTLGFARYGTAPTNSWYGTPRTLRCPQKATHQRHCCLVTQLRRNLPLIQTGVSERPDPHQKRLIWTRLSLFHLPRKCHIAFSVWWAVNMWSEPPSGLLPSRDHSSIRACGSGLMFPVPFGNTRQNFLRIRLVMVPLFENPW